MNPLSLQSLSTIFLSFSSGSISHPIVFLFGRSGSGKNTLVNHFAHKHGLTIHNEQYFDAYHHPRCLCSDDYFHLAITTRLPDPTSIVVLQNLPSRAYLHLKSTQAHLHTHLTRPSVLLIMVSNLSIYYPKHIYQLFGHHIITKCIVINFKPYSDSQIKSILNQYLAMHSTVSSKSIPLSDLVDSAQGDARQAIMSLQWHLATRPKEKQKKKDSTADIFHLIAKFLYNKRLVKGQTKPVYLSKQELLKKDNLIYFDIQQIINIIVMSGIRYDLFIQQHVPDYYYSICDLAHLYDALIQSDLHHNFYWQLRFHDFSSLSDCHFNTHQNYLLLGYATMLHNLDGNKVTKTFRALGRNQHQQQLETMMPDIKMVLRHMASDQDHNTLISIRDLVLNYSLIKKIDQALYKQGRIQLHSSVGQQVVWQQNQQRHRQEIQKRQLGRIQAYQEEDPSDVE